MHVHISYAAITDLEQIADYIAKDNPQRALSFVRELREKCFNLGCMPKAYPLVSRYEKFGIRKRVHGNYLIFYRIETERVVILRVLNSARDYTDLLT